MDIQFSAFLPPRTLRKAEIFLPVLFPEFPASYIRWLCRSGCVALNGVPLCPVDRIRSGDRISIRFEYAKSDCEPEDLWIDILYECDDFAVVNKDPGMSVQVFPGEYGRTWTLVNALLFHFGESSVLNWVVRPGIAHRLDKDTSGIILVGKNDRTTRTLQAIIAERKIVKTYLAVVVGAPGTNDGEIRFPIGRESHGSKKMTTIQPVDPKDASTDYRLLETMDSGHSLLEIALHTGRTHQIRVHLASIGCPIAGDSLYGNDTANADALSRFGLSRQWLHARSVSFELFGVPYAFTAPLKQDLLPILRANRIGLE